MPRGLTVTKTTGLLATRTIGLRELTQLRRDLAQARKESGSNASAYAREKIDSARLRDKLRAMEAEVSEWKARFDRLLAATKLTIETHEHGGGK